MDELLVLFQEVAKLWKMFSKQFVLPSERPHLGIHLHEPQIQRLNRIVLVERGEKGGQLGRRDFIPGDVNFLNWSLFDEFNQDIQLPD